MVLFYQSNSKTNANGVFMAKKKFNISLLLIIIGALCIAAALLLEAIQFPWRAYVGIIPEAEEMPDPPPLVLEGADKDIPIFYETTPPGQITPGGTTYAPSTSPGQTAVTNTTEPPQETEPPATNLPGNKVDYGPPSAFVILGIIKIPRIELSQYVLEGADRQMRYGGGHIPGTARLGKEGNCAIAGHRAYAFRYLTHLKLGDKIILKENNVSHTYTVYEIFEVEPNEMWVLNPIEGESHTLTLITCTPLVTYSQRLIIRARLENTP